MGEITWTGVQKEKYEKGKPGEINFLQSINKTQEYVAQYTAEGYRAKEEGTKKICWVNTSVPQELLFSFDVLPFAPEFSACMCAFERTSTKYQRIAENYGFDIEVCGNARCSMGEVYSGRTKEEGAWPAPDFLIAQRQLCGTHVWWFDYYRNYFKIPFYATELPYKTNELDEKLPKHQVDYYVAQMKGLIKFLEEQTGKKFDIDKYREIVKRSNRVFEQWSEILNYGKLTPTPFCDWDLYVPLIIVIMCRGLQAPIDLLDGILEEIRFRVKNKIAALPNERFRLFFNGNPSWFNFQFVPAMLAARGAIFVASHTSQLIRYFSAIGSGSFEDMANGLAGNYPNLSLPNKIEETLRVCKNYNTNGAIFQDNRGCRAFVFGFYDVIRALEEELNLPCLLYESSGCDMRFWSDDEVRSKVDEYLDLLEEKVK